LEPANRKLIRPSFNEVKEMVTRKTTAPSSTQKKTVPPDQTNAENYYYVKQMQSKTTMVIVLKDGEAVTGIIEWYDKGCLKVNREGAPNVLVFKHNIKYMYKA
jgi:host factor-I protein